MNTTLEAYIEIFGVLAALVYVYLEIKQRWSMWCVGLVSSLVYVYVFYALRFYADMCLSGYYAFAGIYGMWCWRAGAAKPDDSGRTTLQVSHITLKLASILALIASALFFTIRYLLIHYTVNPASPVGDALTAALSIVGMYMLTRKKIEHWLVWIVVNVISTGLYLYKNLYPTAGLYGIYTVLSFYGYWRWRKTMARAEYCK